MKTNRLLNIEAQSFKKLIRSNVSEIVYIHIISDSFKYYTTK